MSDDLQFDKAEFQQAPAPATCTACQAAITNSYFEINGKVVCASCRERVEGTLTGGSRAGRFVKALVLGFGAAVVGSGIYFAVSALTGYEIGFISIIVGLLVGLAVRKGSGGRGGWAYQALAMILTYNAIVATYVPQIIRAFGQVAEQKEKEKSSATGGATPAQTETAAAGGGQSGQKEGWLMKLPGPVRVIVAWLFLFGLAFIAPFLPGVSNILGLIIIGIGLYEAWKINKRPVIRISGPYQLAVATPPAAPSGG